MRCQDLIPKTNKSNQTDTTSEWYNEIWKRWQQNEFPLLKPAECSDSSQTNLALALIACVTEDVKPAIRDFTAKKHQLHHQITADDQNRDTIAQSEFCSWLRQHYYDGICEFLIRQFIDTKTLPHQIVDETSIHFLHL